MPAQTAASEQRRDPPNPYRTRHTPASEEEPFRVSFVPGGIEVSAKITSRGKADELLAAIQALRLLLPPIDNAAQPDESEHSGDDEAA